MTKAICIVLATLVCAARASADTPATPWTKDVTPAQKAAAQRLLDAGNQLFLGGHFPEALAKYKEAVASWNHPAIRFNMVRALIALDRPLEAAGELDQALAYGKDPLDDQVYAEALNYRTLLAGQIATLEIACSQLGVAISLDGKQLAACPGTTKLRAQPGSHVVVGRKPGLLTTTIETVALPGKTRHVDVKLKTLAEATVMRARWDAWKPWALVGGGVALAGAGLLVNLKARSDLDDAQRDIDTRCANTGCTPAQLGSVESNALTENKIAIGMMIAGGAIVVTGVTLVILNRPRAVVQEGRLQLAATPTMGSVTIVGRF